LSLGFFWGEVSGRPLEMMFLQGCESHCAVLFLRMRS
jgi:hypothetical protein